MSRANFVFATVCFVSAFTIACSGNKVSASDSQIETEIQSKLYSDPSTRQSGIAVSVKDGAVTLSGDVPNNDVELAAMKVANGVSGVRGVADQMKVNAAAASTPPPSEPATPAPAVKAPSSVAPTQLAQKNPAPPSTPTPTAQSEVPPPAASPSTVASSSSSSTPRDAEPAPAPRPVERAKITIPSGERLSVRTIDAIDSGKVSEGQVFRASLESPLSSGREVIVPAGAPITLEVSEVKSAGRIKGNSELSLRATSLEYRGRNYAIATSEYSDTGKGRGKNTALKTGIGAGIGALIGGLAGGGKGAAIGAGAGGGAGFGYNALTHGQQIKIPSETVLNFQLQNSLTLPAPRQ